MLSKSIAARALRLGQGMELRRLNQMQILSRDPTTIEVELMRATEAEILASNQELATLLAHQHVGACLIGTTSEIEADERDFALVTQSGAHAGGEQAVDVTGQGYRTVRVSRSQQAEQRSAYGDAHAGGESLSQEIAARYRAFVIRMPEWFVRFEVFVWFAHEEIL